MTVTQLQQMLEGLSGGSFSVTASQLAIADVTELFSNYLGASALTLAGASADAANLSVSGQLALGEENVAAQAQFLDDASGANITGITITFSLPGWSWTSPSIQITATSAAQYLSSPQLALSASGNDPDNAAAAANLSATIFMPNGPCTMTAPVPPPDPQNPAGLALEGNPNVTLQNLAALEQFVAGASFDVIPEGIPIADSLTLTDIALTVGPNIDAITGLMFTVFSNVGLTLIPGIFEIQSFQFKLMVQFPATSTTVYGSLTTTMTINGVEIEVTLLVTGEDIVIDGALVQSLPLSTLLEDIVDISGIPFEAQMSDLMFGISLGTPFAWQFEIGLTNLWTVNLPGDLTFTFESLIVNASGAQSTTPDLLVYSSYSIAGAELYLSAQEDTGDWTFSGGTVGYQVINFVPLLQGLAGQFNLDSSLLPSSLTALDLTSVQLTYSTGSSNNAFLFSCTGQLAISDVTIDARMNLGITSGSNGFTVDFQGTLAITAGATTVTFETVVETTGTQTLLIGTENSENTPLDLQDFLQGLGFDAPIPQGLDISLIDLGVLYQIQPGQNSGDSSSTFIVTANSNYGSALFIAMKQVAGGSASTTYLFAANAAITGSLAQLPIIGQTLPPDLDVRLDSLQIQLASAAFTAVQVTAINTLLVDLKQYLPAGNWQLAPGAIVDLAQFSMTLTIGGDNTSYTLGVDSAAPSTLLALGDGSPSAEWLSIQKTLGPLSLNRIGFAYNDGEIEFLLDASLTLGVLSISLMGLSIGSPLTSFQPTFNLDGLGLQLNADVLSISGSFLSMTPNGLNDPNWEYAGQVSMQAEAFGIAAIGAYGQFQGNTSLFLFAMLTAPLGGPAFFFVTGLAGGFGYNRALQIPALSDLPAFPLVEAATSGQTGNNPFQGTNDNPAAALQVMEQYLSPSIGEDWGALGVQFTSFELIQSFALLTVSFGNTLEIALLGLSAVTVPPLDPNPVAFAELELAVVFAPAAGVLEVAAQLTPSSYILSQSCHLTGGFAFYTWFEDDPATGATAGEFVVTLGGYFPGYDLPQYYPSVPILGANWQVDSNLSIKGGVYFALVPSAVMAGGYLECTWQCGNFSAWFNADANFLLSWKPFHYQAEMSISIGASYRLNVGAISHTFTVHVGVSLSFWGPSFAGVAYVDLDVVSFTISFGGGNPPIQPIPWSEFKSSFLPAPQTSPAADGPPLTAATGPVPTTTNTYCLIQASAGIRKDLTQTPNPQNISWVVDPEKLVLVTSSVVPITAASWTTGSGSEQGGNQSTPLSGDLPNNFGVGPVGIANGDLGSQHAITINQLSGGAINYAYVVGAPGCSIIPATSALPAAPWSKAMSLDLVQNPSISTVNSTPSTIAGLVTGYVVTMNIQPPDATPSPISLAILADSPAETEPQFSWSQTPIASTDPFDQSQAMSQFMTTINNETVAAARAAILATLIAQGVPVAATVNVVDLAASANVVLLAAPVLSYLGEERAPS